MKGLALLLAALALAGCSTAPGTGWSRAPDLSVYGAMSVYARAALDQEMLCAGFTRESATQHWEADYGPRQDAVNAALVGRYGEAALTRARATWAPSVACGDVPDRQWRDRYVRQLRLLELRLSLTPAPGQEG
jgi:hypothetical protein